ncbi:hypothetical protein NKR23_g11701 [Pleurostoma richardsiae]|uniref:Altered inheritance of mitochondria protein 41 n=1 Tax=Pleurostoma richardsiae TaxID=41990 RepID=A0AA38R2N7_9PEZI|nr:hypothetical protein NKR23_g11701 [Pleurostoma richardsiae]
MKAKDVARLSALRAILSATTNAAKTATPIRTDTQLVALLRKTAKANQEAVEEARAAGRQDIVDKEEAQIRILEEYAAQSGVQTVAGDELRSLVQAVVSEVAATGVDKAKQTGEAMKKLNAKGGPLDGKDVDRAEVAKLVKELTA